MQETRCQIITSTAERGQHFLTSKLIPLLSSSSAPASASASSFTSRFLLLLTMLPLSLALLAFVLQWKGDNDLTDPTSAVSSTSRWAPHGSRLQNHEVFLGMELSPSTLSPKPHSSSPSDCLNLARSALPSFPYYRDWKLDFETNLMPKEMLHLLMYLKFWNLSLRIWNETWLSSFFYKPCNYELFVKQSLNMEMAIIRARVEGWDLVNECGILKLNRSMKVKSFTKGLELFKLVAGVAEAEGHHPDLHLVRWNNVTIEIWTHAIGGLTENDFILAAKINKLDLHHLLRKKISA